MTKEEKCRTISEWLGLSHPHTVKHDQQQAEQSDTCDLCGVPRHSHSRGIPDFFTDESASALILEKLLESDYYAMVRTTEGYTFAPMAQFYSCMPRCPDRYSDRKTAIAEACMKLLSTPHASPTR